MGSFFHESDVLRRGIGALAVLNGVDEAVSELAERAQKVVLDEIHHAVIWESRGQRFRNDDHLGAITVRVTSASFLRRI